MKLVISSRETVGHVTNHRAGCTAMYARRIVTLGPRRLACPLPSNHCKMLNGADPEEENNMKKLTVLSAALGVTLLCASPISLQRSPAGTVFISTDKAEARVGRPLTPGSVAGVHRRVHRRAYYGAAVGAAAVTGAYYHRRHCGYYPYGPC